MTVEIHALEDRRGLRVRDTAEGEQFPLRTDRAVDPEPAATDGFAVPVDTAVAVDARELHSPVYTDAVFRRDGEVVHRADSAATSDRLPRDTYEVALSPPGANLYVRVHDAAVAARFTDGHTYLDAGEPTRLVVGVRSHHETPEGTVTTTDDPRDVMAAVSTFGSALKTLSPDRSWPTLRGHPPALERGDDLHVPDAATPPDTGVTIEVPPDYGAIYTVAPLAYYLGATLQPGDHPRLLADGHAYDFDASNLVGDVRDLLVHAFTLDCVVRTAGVYPFRTLAADRIDERVDLDYGALFDRSLDERTAAYLDVPRAATDGLLDWHYTADVAPQPRYAPALPFLLDELALVRSPPEAACRWRDAATEHETNPSRPDTASEHDTRPSTVVPADADTPGQSWTGDGYAVGAANPTVGSFRRGFEWPDGDGPLDVHVVHNRPDGEQPGALYDGHLFAETTVRTSRALTTSELRDALYDDTDFLHFVGHVTDDGMVCPDGTLDTRTLARTGVNAFFLDGCRSYEQGRALLTAGSVGGIVTLEDLGQQSAGREVAMLLDAGYPLYGVLDVLDLAGGSRDRYAVLGEGTSAVRRSVTGAPLLSDFDTTEFGPDTDPLPLSVHHYPYGENGMGAMVDYSQMNTPTYVQGGSVRDVTLPRSELESYLDLTGMPTLVDGDLYRTDDLSADDFA